MRIELWGDEVERISKIDPLTGDTIAELDQCAIYPGEALRHRARRRSSARCRLIRAELAERLHELKSAGKLLEAQRLESRTGFDIEMLLEIGTCAGIENYSRHLTGRLPGERPACLLDYFPADYLVVVDESHVSLPQIGGMFNGDRARKTTLVEYGFRLPSALDNRPLQFEEFMAPGAADDQRLGHAGRLGAAALGRRRGGADHPADRPGRPRGGDPPGEGAGGRPAPRDPRTRARQRAGAGHHADQADVRGPHRLPAAGGRAGALPPLRHRRHRADGDPARPPARRFRRAGGHQPAARGTRPARGVAGGDSRRRPGGIPALRSLPGPDDRAGGAQRARAWLSCTPTGSPARCSARSPRWTGAARSSAPTTSSTASRRCRSSSRSRRCGCRLTWPTRARSGSSRSRGAPRPTSIRTTRSSGSASWSSSSGRCARRRPTSSSRRRRCCATSSTNCARWARRTCDAVRGGTAIRQRRGRR